jgi:SAM-dependent methyltransferase
MPFFRVQQFYFHIVGNKIECNICHYKANKFNNDNWHLYTACPNCSAGVRQRLLIASLTYIDNFSFDNIISNKKVLHFAPDRSFYKLIKGVAEEYKTADFLAEGYSYDKIDFNIDISDMKSIKNESFDCVIACDVLEHVPNHLGGIREVNRILKKGGYCIFTVPQKDNLKVTFEDLSITDKKEREKVFGQHDHLRIYGDDFISMLNESGFEATAVDESFFDKDMVNHYVLFPPILSKKQLATNYRKIFFGKKIQSVANV